MTMKIRRSIIWLAAIAAAFIALVFLFWQNQPAKTPLTASIETNVASSATTQPSPVFSAPDRTNVLMTNAATKASTPKPALGSKWERALGILATYNDVPIDFYGKLEDQFGNPVVGADIKASIMVINAQREGTDHPITTSDANGLFQFHGRGERIGIMPRKEGYALASTNTGAIYSLMWPEDERTHSDPRNPILIKMWKLQGSEPLLKINQTYKPDYTGEPIYFDLIAGTIVPSGGDIKLTVSRTPGLISGRNQQDWSVQVEAVDGGLMDSSGQEAVTYIAPDSGYQPGTNFIFSTNASQGWFSQFNHGFFVMSRNTQLYSKLGFSFRINQDPNAPMSVTFYGVANTNGSRNWEGDPNIYQPQ